MAVAQYRDFAHRDVLPATWTDAIERFLTARENFAVRKQSATTVEVFADATVGPAGVMIGGKPRWIEATQSRVIAGGAGTYDLYVVAAANSFAAGAPTVGEIDNTFYGFELRSVAAGGAAPVGNLAGGQAIAHTRKVRTVAWDGAAITSIDRLATDGPAGTLALGNGVTLGADVNAYRGAADVLQTDDAIRAALDVRARNGAASQAAVGALGPAAEAALALGSAADAVIYRSGAAALKTAASVAAAGGYSLGAALVGTPAYQAQQVAAQTVIRNKLLAADANDAFHVLGDGKHEWGPGGGTVVDTNLYRSAVGVVKTDGAFYAVGAQYANFGLATQIIIGSVGGNAGVTFGSAADAAIYRTSANSLRTDGVLEIQGSAQVDRAGTSGKLFFGAAADTSIYRSAADTVKTDDTLRAALNIVARDAAAGQVTVGIGTGIGSGTEAGLLLGSAGDTNLYRFAADTLKTDDALFAARFEAAAGTGVAAFRGVQIAAQALLSNYLLTGDANPSFRIRGDGQIGWGPGGAPGLDTLLARGAGAGSLSLTGGLIALAPETAPPLSVSGSAPAAVAGAGTVPFNISIAATPGGATTGVTGQAGGSGGSINITAGSGGNAPGGSTNGAGGFIQLTAGAAGGGAGAAGARGGVLVGAAADKIGFFGSVTGVVKPAVAGSRGGNAALASLLTALASLGLLTDNSTA